MGIEKDRLRLEWISASEGKNLQKLVDEMTETVAKLRYLVQVKEVMETLS